MKERYSKASQARILSSDISQVSTPEHTFSCQNHSESCTLIFYCYYPYTPSPLNPCSFQILQGDSLFNQKCHPSFFYCRKEEDNRLFTEKEFSKFSVLITMLICLRRPDDIVERNICKICIKMQIRGINYK